MSRSPFHIKGGVTPFKKGEKGAGSGKSVTRKQHAGKVGVRATNVSPQDRSGYSRSGRDFINVHSFTGNTRLSSSMANTLGPSISRAVRGTGNVGTGDIKMPDIDTVLEKIKFEVIPGKDAEFTESYDDFWDIRIKSGEYSDGMKSFLKGVDMNDPDAVAKAKAKWKEVSIKNRDKRLAEKKKNAKDAKGVVTYDGEVVAELNPGEDYTQVINDVLKMNK